jgi:adenylyltransferase/sulfurtransferase
MEKKISTGPVSDLLQSVFPGFSKGPGDPEGCKKMDDMTHTATIPNNNNLTDEDRLRFARQVCMPEIGVVGQARLKDAGVLVVGAGGLGSAALLYLAAAGVGRIGIVDPDTVELGNLHRQIIHGTSTLGGSKTESARWRLADLAPQIRIDAYPELFSESNAETLTRPYRIVLDATDNLAARKWINRVCIRQQKPMVFGSVLRFEGQTSVFDAPRGPCYRCAFPDLPDSGVMESPAQAGVFGPLPGIIGTLQALETLKILLGVGEPLIGRLLIFDGLSGKFDEVLIRKNPICPECGNSG